MNKEIIKEFDEWFAKTMADCAMYEFPEKGIEGLLEGKTGKFSGFCFLKQYVQKRINFEIKKALQANQEDLLKKMKEVIEEEYGEGEAVTNRIVSALRNKQLLK